MEQEAQMNPAELKEHLNQGEKQLLEGVEFARNFYLQIRTEQGQDGLYNHTRNDLTPEQDLALCRWENTLTGLCEIFHLGPYERGSLLNHSHRHGIDLTTAVKYALAGHTQSFVDAIRQEIRNARLSSSTREALLDLLKPQL